MKLFWLFALIFLSQLSHQAFAASDRDIADQVSRRATESDFLFLEAAQDENAKDHFQNRLTELFSPQNQELSLADSQLLKILNTPEDQSGAHSTSFTYAVNFGGHKIHFLEITFKHGSEGQTQFALAALSHVNNSGFWRWPFLALAFLVPFTMLLAAFFCLRQPSPLRPFWLLFIFIGVCKIDLNWPTGVYKVYFLKFIFFGFQVSGEQLSISFPLAAITYLLFRRKSRHLRGSRVANGPKKV